MFSQKTQIKKREGKKLKEKSVFDWTYWTSNIALYIAFFLFFFTSKLQLIPGSSVTLFLYSIHIAICFVGRPRAVIRTLDGRSTV